jgi:4-aminobutyrate aminotransferase-like enzyme
LYESGFSLNESYRPEEIAEMSKRFLIHVAGHVPITIVGGKGAILIDAKGKEYIDCTSQAWSLNLGPSHPKIVEAVKRQVEKLEFASLAFDVESRALLAKRLAEIAPAGLSRSVFVTSGSEAIEGAMHFAMRYTGGQEFVTLYHGFHGRTFSTIALSYTYPTFVSAKIGVERHIAKPIRVPNYYCYRCYFGLEYPDCDLFCARFVDTAIKHAADGKVAGVIAEPVQGNGGQITPPPGYFTELKKICKDHDIPLIIDEIQTGFGRCGRMFACEVYGIDPDILCLGKAMGGGYPLAGVMTSNKYADLDQFTKEFEYGFTFGAHPVACAAALAMLDIYHEEKLLENVIRIGELITKGLKEIMERYTVIGDVRGPGLMIGIELVEDRKTKKPANEKTNTIVRKGLERGVIFGKSGFGSYGNVLKIKPPLNITSEQANKVLSVLESILKEVR